LLRYFLDGLGVFGQQVSGGFCGPGGLEFQHLAELFGLFAGEGLTVELIEYFMDEGLVDGVEGSQRIFLKHL
jgi:hypothetical protein